LKRKEVQNNKKAKAVMDDDIRRIKRMEHRQRVVNESNLRINLKEKLKEETVLF
jgi:hypothetical protein